jgi:hypothetical protein
VPDLARLGVEDFAVDLKLAGDIEEVGAGTGEHRWDQSALPNHAQARASGPVPAATCDGGN